MHGGLTKAKYARIDDVLSVNEFMALRKARERARLAAQAKVIAAMADGPVKLYRLTADLRIIPFTG